MDEKQHDYLIIGAANKKWTENLTKLETMWPGGLITQKNEGKKQEEKAIKRAFVIFLPHLFGTNPPGHMVSKNIDLKQTRVWARIIMRPLRPACLNTIIFYHFMGTTTISFTDIG